MRSLIKMEVSRYPVFDLAPTAKLPYNEQSMKRTGVATHHSARPMTHTKRSSIYSPSNRNQIQEVALNNYQSHSDRDQYSNRLRTSQQKRCIEKFISGLAQDIEDPSCQPGSGENKLKVLKKIIQHYDIKNLEKKQYSKLIKTFGLKIQSAQTINEEIKSMNQTTSNYRKFSIKSNASNRKERFSRLRNRISGDNQDNQVALFDFSQQMVSHKQKTKRNIKISVKKKAQSMRLTNDNKEQKSKESIHKKRSPLKFKSSQDVIVQKVNRYREFLFSLNYSNHLYCNLDIIEYEKPLKYYIGHGNNSNMIKSLFKKRYWFQETTKPKHANFIWTQIKIEDVFNQQQSNIYYSQIVSQKQLSIHMIQKKGKIDQKLRRTTNTTSGKGNLNSDNLSKILSQKDTLAILRNEAYCQQRKLTENIFRQKSRQCGRKLNYLGDAFIRKIQNHLPSNGLLGNKKGMFYCMREYFKLTGRNIWTILPLTFHISSGVNDPDFKQFLGFYQERKKKRLNNIWIMKPGEFSNQGQGITCSNKLQQIKKRVSKCQTIKRGNRIEQKTLILQLYITNPLLYNNRKFDIRVYMLVTCHNGKIKGYWYQDGYVRTSSYLFDLRQLGDRDIHLTNDAVQKQSDLYGKYEPANKLSFAELQRYVDSLPANGRILDVYSVLIPKMKQIASQALKSSFLFLDQCKKQHNFQIFGLDFMVDYYFSPWLIQINTNPCLELSCPLLERIIPNMVQNALRISVDSLFPPPQSVPHNYKYNIPENALHYNKFQLIFDEDRDGSKIKKLYEENPSSKQNVASLMNIEEQKEVYEEEGILCDYDI